MALGHSAQTGNSRPTIYASLGHGENTGFRVKGADGTMTTYSELTGVLVGLKTRQELTGEAAKSYKDRGTNPSKVDISKCDPSELHDVVLARFRDEDESQPDIVLTFPVTDSLGGKILGMLNTVRMSERMSDPVTVFTFYREPNSRYNDSSKGKSSVNAIYAGDEKIRESYIQGTYMTSEGDEVYLNDQGQSYPPMGKEIPVGKGKTVWNFEERDGVLSGTAVALAYHFVQQQTPTNAEADRLAAEVAAAEDGGIDLDEAAAAAAPGTH